LEIDARALGTAVTEDVSNRLEGDTGAQEMYSVGVAKAMRSLERYFEIASFRPALERLGDGCGFKRAGGRAGA
jgi:hypothetical protein